MIARYAFNELMSFIAGWAICLDYLILVALCAFATTDYLGTFWHEFNTGLVEFAIGRGGRALRRAGGDPRRRAAPLRPRRRARARRPARAGRARRRSAWRCCSTPTCSPTRRRSPARRSSRTSCSRSRSCSSRSAASTRRPGLAGQVAIGRSGPPAADRRAADRRRRAVRRDRARRVLGAAGRPAGRYVEAPLLGVADAFEQAWLRDVLRYVIAVSAVVILVAAAQSAMLGLSRLGYSLAVNRQIPSRDRATCRPTRATPVVVIAFGAIVAIGLLIPADLEFLAAIYAFGATLAFFDRAACRSSGCATSEPDRDRPVPDAAQRARVRRRPADPRRARASLMSALAFVALLIEHGGARWVGLVWMGFGIALYVGYRTSEGKPLLKRVTVPEARADAAAGDRGRVRLDARPDPRHAARRRHHADGRAARRRRTRPRARAAR